MKYVTKLLNKNIKEAKVRDLSWLWTLIALSIYLFIIMAIMSLITSSAESVQVGAYVESNCENTRCVLIDWNHRLIKLPSY